MPARRARLCASAAAVAALTGAGLLSAAGPAAAANRLPLGCTIEISTVTCDYSFTGGEQVFLVPPRLTSIQVAATGASAGVNVGTTRGAGAIVSGTLTVVPGTDLYIEVGGAGAAAVGGFNGGGGAGAGGGAGGGGASDLRTVPNAAAGSLASRLLVAGGGGGAGATGICALGNGTPLGGSGGNAGTTGSAANGGTAALCTDATGTTGGGGGGTLAAGGAAGATTVSGAAAGVAGILGIGASASTGGGGGGGGYYGGGSGAGNAAGPGAETQSAGGGGGGSSLVPAGGSATLATAGTPGSLTITYKVPPVIADVAVSISGPHAATGGARFTELITITNNGPDAAFAVTTSLNIPSHLGLLWAPHARIGTKKLWWNASVLASGASVTYRATFRPGTRFRGGAEFRASVASGGSADPDLSNNKATYWVHVTPPAAR